MITVSPKVIKLEDVTERDVFEFRGLIIQFEMAKQPGWLRGRVRVANVEVADASWTVAYAQTIEGQTIEVPVRRLNNDFYCVLAYANKPSVFRVTADRLDELSGEAVRRSAVHRIHANNEDLAATKYQQLKAQML